MATRDDTICLFAPAASATLGARVGAALGVALSAIEEREFEGGEHKIRPLVSVRRKSVYVVQSLHGDMHGSANDRLCRLLFFIGALKDAGAACTPYLAYARKDRRTKARDPVTARYVAQLFEAASMPSIQLRIVHTLDSHRFLELVGVPVSEEHPGEMGLDRLDVRGSAAIAGWIAQHPHLLFEP